MSEHSKIDDGYMPTHKFMESSSAATKTFARDGKLSVVFQGEEAYTTGDVIVFPALDQTKPLTEAQVAVGRGFVDHEAGHHRHTDLPAYKAAAQAAKDRGDNFFPQVLNALEDVRIEKLILDEYVGARRDLAAAHHQVNETFLSEVFPKDPSCVENWKQIAAVAITWEGFARAGYDDVVIPGIKEKTFAECQAKLPEAIRNKTKLWIDALSACKNTKDVIDLAKRVCGEAADEAMKAPSAGSDTGTGKGTGSGTGSGSGSGSSAGGTAGSGSDKGSGKGGGADGEISGPNGEFAETKGLSGGGGHGAGGTLTGHAYDEFAKLEVPTISADINVGKAFKSHTAKPGTRKDAPYRAFSNASDRVHTQWDRPGKYKNYTHGQRLAKPEGQGFYHTNLASAKSNLAVMRRKLERALMAKQRVDWQGGQYYGRLNNKQLVQAVNGIENVYRHRLDAPALDTAVQIVIDLSGSMMGDKVHLAQIATILIGEVLEKAGVPWEVTGFSCSGGYHAPGHGEAIRKAHDAGLAYSRWEALDIYVFKAFDDTLRQAKRSLGMISNCAGGNNADGDSVLFSYQRLAKRREQRKIMLVMSDGYPAQSTSYNREHINQWLRDVVEFIRLQHVELVGIGIMDDAVKQFYPKYTVLQNIDQLPKTVMDHVAKMLLGERFMIDNGDLLSVSGAVNKALGRR